MTPAVLAVDAGQTEIRAALADGERGPRSATAPGVLRMGLRVGPEEVAEALLAALVALRPLPEPLPPLGVGLSGFEAAAEADLRRVGELLRARLSVERLSIASDGVTSLLGALGERDGAAVAAGTGTVCVARRGERLAKVDGWGTLLGDAGSGFAIGRAGLDAALRHADGRGGSAALLRAAERRYAPLPDLPERIYSADVPARAVAAFAADVAQEAAAGEPHAEAILADAASELALTACAGLGRLFEPDEPAAVSYAGNVFRAGTPLLRPFTHEVLSRRPGTEVLAPDGDALAGAALLAALDDGLRPQPGLLWRAAA
ncbi:MAG TPA: BadF/BadG/BcrA/BcrD ATPase family protein [Thermoleophilaceae bacterium]|nr:BadF/BadG/BcrA/BcrD ATPase family protein [Thermoleophilaceae bacterium]